MRQTLHSNEFFSKILLQGAEAIVRMNPRMDAHSAGRFSGARPVARINRAAGQTI